jgi:hypothetical protein
MHAVLHRREGPHRQWAVRLQMVADVAAAVAYLHDEVRLGVCVRAWCVCAWCVFAWCVRQRTAFALLQ